MRPTTRPLAAILVAGVLLACLAVPVLAKEFLQAHLDAPIAMDTPPGTEILVGVTVDDGSNGPVEGSPIQLVLTGRDGSTTRAAGAADGIAGHYVMRIVIPAGGARDAQVVMHGTSDLPITLTEDPFTFGGVTARTAQVAPPLAPPMTPYPRPSVDAAAPAASVPTPAPVPGPAGQSPLLAVGLVAVIAGLGLGVLALVRRSRGTRRPSTAGRSPGA